MLLKEITVNYQISEDLDFCLFQSSKMFYFFFFSYFVIYVSLVISFIAIVLSHLAPCFFFGCWMKAGCMIRPLDGCEGDLARRFKSRKTVT